VVEVVRSGSGIGMAGDGVVVAAHGAAGQDTSRSGRGYTRLPRDS
jgi:hypothetical protein